MTGKQFSLPNGLNGLGSSGVGPLHHSTGKSKQFSIEDAFEEETDEAIKVYGSTTATHSVSSPAKNNGNGLCLHASTDTSNKHTRENGATCIAMDGGPRGSYKVVHEASRDSDSLIQDCYGDIADGTDGNVSCTADSPTHLSCFRHPKVRENWRMVFAATCLLVLGIILIGFGTVTLAESHKRLQGVVFLLTGFICFLPGIYHVVYIYLAATGKRGYHFHNLPLFT